MAQVDRWTAERIFHDRQARRRAATFVQHPERLLFDDDAYLDHETWIRPAFQRLGDVAGLRVLDLGSGHGMASVVLARRGALLTALDLSYGYLDEARNRAGANGVAVQFVQANGNRLPFADSTFDRIWGSAVLHHLDIAAAARELKRVLRPGGLAVLCEPWGENRLVSWARQNWHYSGKERTPDEVPLRRQHVRLLRQVFARVETQGYQLLSMPRRLIQNRGALAGLDWCDDMLLSRLPALQNYCRYMVIALHVA